jgi:hypothetical protein
MGVKLKMVNSVSRDGGETSKFHETRLAHVTNKRDMLG